MMEYATVTANPTDYQVAKTDSKKWQLTCNGIPVQGYSWSDTKKACVEAIAKFVSRAQYTARIMTEDETGHVWTAEESKDIAEYAERLKENKTRFTMSGNMSVVESGRRGHYSEIRTIMSHYGFGEPTTDWSTLTCAEIRRRRAARTEAFRLAGVELDQNYYTLTLLRTNHPTKPQVPHVYDYRTMDEARDEAREILVRAEHHGETYSREYNTVKPAWPIVCRFYK